MSDAPPPDAAAAQEPAHAYPARYWWLTRLSALAVLFVLALAGVRWWWGAYAEHRLNALIDDAHAKGQKIVVADYQMKVFLSDDRNAAFYYKRAHQTLKTTKAEEWAIDNAQRLPLRQDVFDTIGAALKTNKPFLADVREARRHARADWGVNIVSPMWSVLLPHLNQARWTANISRAAAMHAMQRGDHGEAIEHVRDILAMSDSLDDSDMFLVTHLVQVGIESLGADAASEIAIDLQTAGADVRATTRPIASPASREQVAALIARLLDDGPRRTSLQHALQGERTAQVDIGMNVATRAPLVRPSIQLDMVGLADEGEQTMKAALASDWKSAQAQIPPPPKAIEGPRAVAHVVSQSVRPALSGAVRTDARAAAKCRLAAAALAIRMYQLDHAGQRPATLDALVPNYLPAVPTDPFNGSAPIRYIADGDDPYVYSVGEDGADDSANTATSRGWRPDATTIEPLKAPDLFLRLMRTHAPPPTIDDPPDPLTAPATTQP
jgi:hypothetical protein